MLTCSGATVPCSSCRQGIGSKSRPHLQSMAVSCNAVLTWYAARQVLERTVCRYSCESRVATIKSCTTDEHRPETREDEIRGLADNMIGCFVRVGFRNTTRVEAGVGLRKLTSCASAARNRYCWKSRRASMRVCSSLTLALDPHRNGATSDSGSRSWHHWDSTKIMAVVCVCRC